MAKWLRQRFATRLRRANPDGAAAKYIPIVKNYYIYILQSLKDNKHYTGYTNNLERRLKQHEEGLVISTRNRRPLKLIHSENFSSQKEAREREKFLKSGQGRKELKKILNNK